VVTILASDIHKTAAFYTELLGFEIVEPFSRPEGGFLWLRSEKRSSSIAIYDIAKRSTRPTVATIPVEPGGVMIGFCVDDATAVYEDWKARGVNVEIRTDMFDMGKGLTFGAKDPAGTYIQVFDVYPKYAEIAKQLGLD
jgi:predicted enzyme related to lactoylglutathione lyase